MVNIVVVNSNCIIIRVLPSDYINKAIHGTLHNLDIPNPHKIKIKLVYLDGVCREELSQIVQIITQNIHICYNTAMVAYMIKI